MIAADGLGTRWQPLSCNKEIVPVGQAGDPGTGMARPKVMVEYLLEKFRRAGITRAVVVIRPGKWAIPGQFQQ